MKYKLIGIFGIIVILLATAAAAAWEPEPDQAPRVHQHLTARRDTGCGCDGTELCSHLPLVIIDTGGQEIPGEVLEARDRFGQGTHSVAADGEKTILASFTVIDNQDRNNHPSDEPAFTTVCRIRIRGNSSRHFPKKPYAVTFVDEEGLNRDLPVMGMDAHHDWVFHGPSLDKTLVRNYMSYNLAGEIMHWAPNCRYCEVILNGDYVGIYLIVEPVSAGENCRLNMKVKAKGARGIGYIIRSDRPDEEDLETTSDIYSFLERASRIFENYSVQYPGRNSLTPEVARDIEQDLSAFEKELFSFDYDDPVYGYRAWIDTENFIDYFLINEFSANIDSGRYSTYLYREVGEPLRLCVWDFNNAYDNYRETQMTVDGFNLSGRAWFTMLLRDKKFAERIPERYAQLRETWFNEEYLFNYIDETLEYLGPAVARNNARWPVGTPGENNLSDPERNPATFEEAVTDLKTWISVRGRWLDQNIHAVLQYAHPSRNKKYNH